MTEVFRICERTAAKPHRCDECRKTILPGERYSSWFQVFEGDAYNGHTCLAGKALRAALAGDRDKALHHTISSAAVLANWHAALMGADTSMRPGILPPEGA